MPVIVMFYSENSYFMYGYVQTLTTARSYIFVQVVAGSDM